MSTFTPAKNPDFPITINSEPRVLIGQMGDGYVQRIIDGLNHNMVTLDLTWTNLTAAEAANIFDFMIAHNGADSFDYQPPDPSFASARKWICRPFSKSRTEPQAWTIRATFIQVADPA